MSRAHTNVARGVETKDAILNASLEVFAHRGYRGASLAAIAERCGIVQGAILHHFGSKEQLLLALLNRYFAPDGSLFGSDSAGAGPEAVFERLAAIVTTNEHRALLVRFYTVMMGESLTDGHPAGPFFIERFERLRATVADAILSPSHGEGSSLSREDALTRATLYIAVSDGLQSQWLANPRLDMTSAFAALRALMGGRRDGVEAP